VGAFVPILPTTPFLLLAAYFFARSSERLYGWLLGNRFVGDYLRRYYEGRRMSRRHKVITLVLLWAVLASTAAWATISWWVRGVLGGVGVAVTAHVLWLAEEPSGR
jgi:uncharacterized membrane protein YbaN (DUF454 family)